MAADSCQLKSDLARVFLPAPEHNSQRRLAWVNSICIFFLVVGVVGAPRRVQVIGRPPAFEQPIPIIVEPLSTPPPPLQPQQTQTQDQDDKQIAPRVVAVTLNTPAINFSVPTIGNLVVPVAAAPVPPPAALRPTVDARQFAATTRDTGDSGDRPKPPYPQYARDLREEGTVTLLINVNDVGAIATISIKESSGYGLLDRTALNWIKRHWIQPPIKGNHFFQVPIRYELDKKSP